MQFFTLAALCPLAVQAAVIARQASCDATSTVTVTPSAITQVKEIYKTNNYATTSVTMLALETSASAAASTSAAAGEKKLRARQCPSPTTTTTETADAPTVTVSSTVTFSKAARATATAAACQASNNYGLFKGTLNINQQGALPSVQTFPDYTIEECCNACFTSTEGCMSWSFGGSPNNAAVYAGCSMSMMSTGCPSGAAGTTEMIMYPNDDKPLVGVGACGLEVKGF